MRSSAESHKLKVNLRGMAPVVAIVLIILIAVISVSMLAVIVNKSIKGEQVTKEAACLELQTSKVLSIERVCYDLNRKSLKIGVRKGGNDLKEIDIVVHSDRDALYRCGGDSCSSCILLGSGEATSYFLFYEGQPKSVSIKTGNCFLDEKIVVEC